MATKRPWRRRYPPSPYRPGCQSFSGFFGGRGWVSGSHWRHSSSISSSNSTPRTIAQFARYRRGGFDIAPRSRRRKVAIEIPLASASSTWLMPRSTRSLARRVACFDCGLRRAGTGQRYSAQTYPKSRVRELQPPSLGSRRLDLRVTRDRLPPGRLNAMRNRAYDTYRAKETKL
jgi:hypothetical protein